MRAYLIVAWLFVGLAGLIYHLGPGTDQLKLDRIDTAIQQARQCAAESHWDLALEHYDRALADLPSDKAEQSYRLILEKAQAQMMAKQLPVARQTLDALFTELNGDTQANPDLLSEVETALASSQYYMTWLMRLEGLPKEEWLPEIESARQHYLQLAMRADREGDSEQARRSREDLESAVRLARMDLNELQSLPLPSQ